MNILVVNISMGLTFPGVEHLQEKITAKAFQSQLFSNISLKIALTNVVRNRENFNRHWDWMELNIHRVKSSNVCDVRHLSVKH